MADTDGDLMQLLRQGDASAIDRISGRFGQELRLFCRRMVFDEALAEDIVQDVLMACCRIGESSLPSGSLRGWLYRVARNRCIDALRKMHPAQRLSAIQTAHSRPAGPLAIDPATTPARRAARDDRDHRIRFAVDAMDDDLREVVVMHFFQGLATSEIAEALELSLSGAKARLTRATRLLRERLRNLDESGS